MTRRRFIYRPDPETGEMRAIEVSRDFTAAPRSTGDLGKFEYDGLRATDGTPIDSKTKHREYLKATGLAMASDFAESGEKYKAERAANILGETKAYREDVKRDIYQAIQQVRRRR